MGLLSDTVKRITCHLTSVTKAMSLLFQSLINDNLQNFGRSLMAVKIILYKMSTKEKKTPGSQF